MQRNWTFYGILTGQDRDLVYSLTWPTVVRIGVIVVCLAIIPFTSSFPGPGARGVTTAIAYSIAVAGLVLWLLGPGSQRVFVAGLVVLGLTGGVMAGLSGSVEGIAICCAVTSTAGVTLVPEVSAAIAATTVTAFIAAALAGGASLGDVFGYPAMFAGFWAFGLTRHAYVLRARQAERALEQERRAREAETEAAALAERARIAREIHDVLAHSLATVSVNLQAAEGLLSGLPDSPELAKALECVTRAGAFTRDGLAEARRAVTALRSSAVPPAPLAEQVTLLVSRSASPATLEVRGTERAVSAEAGLAVYRTAQEALTNALKHAPGQPVTITLEFGPDAVELRAASPLPPAGPEAPLASSGGGHGLTGLRERAALSGGTLTAGPAEGQWLVCLRIPA